jgi:TPP-dependent pyruvate/acetoin dehydrogenase alpha subunit
MSRKKKKQLNTKVSGRAKRARTRLPGVAAPRAKHTPSVTAVLNSGKLRELYSTMLQCRMLVERRLALLASSNKAPRDEPDARREAVLVGAATHALPGDSIAVAHSSSLVRHIRRTPLASAVVHLLAEGAERTDAAESSSAGEKGHGSPAQLSMIQGMTLAHKAAGSSTLVLVFPGEDPAALAFHYDALALAARHRLPLVCLVETGPSFEWTAERQNAQSGSASHFPEIAVDGCDVVAVFRVAQEAVRRARSGHGPSLIHCVMPESFKSRQPRPAAEPNCDPLELMKTYLRRKGLWSDEWQQKVRDDFSSELDAAITAARSASGAELPFDHVYSAERSQAGSSPAASPSEMVSLTDP